jgi:hypothetical protein
MSSKRRGEKASRRERGVRLVPSSLPWLCGTVLAELPPLSLAPLECALALCIEPLTWAGRLHNITPAPNHNSHSVCCPHLDFK